MMTSSATPSRGAAFQTALLFGALLAAVAVLVVKLVPGAAESAMGSTLAVAIASGATLAVGTSIAMLLRRGAIPADVGVALRVDERLKLDERLTTALALERSDDAYARAAIADAVQKAYCLHPPRVRLPKDQTRAALTASASVPAPTQRCPWVDRAGWRSGEPGGHGRGRATIG